MHGTAEVARDLSQRTLYRRAVEAAIWGMPIVSVDAMRQAFFRDAGAQYGDIVYLSKQADWRFQITTPNASSWYVYIPFNTKDGPLVLDLPAAAGAGLFGSLNDAWQVPLADVGPTGVDEGKGGKYLILPPCYNESVPDNYIPVRFATYNGYSFLRAIPATTSPADVWKALDLVRHTRVYRLSQAASPPPQRHMDIAGHLFDGIAHFDETFYDSLARMVSEEPVQGHDLVAMAQLRSIGIERSKRFEPNGALTELLAEAITEARAGFIHSTMALQSFWPRSQWAIPASTIAAKTDFTFVEDDRLDVDARAQLFFLGCAPPKKAGAASFYLMATKDAAGAGLDGGKSYRLRVAPNVPAKQFWAVTVYDLESAAFVRNAPRVELNSYDRNVQKNEDGSVDAWFGPARPVGLESNWIATVPGKQWFAMFRLYGPDNAVLEKSWRLADLEPL